MLPKISVVFVTYDRLVTLRPTLESFLWKTDYPRDRLELIVADDCSPHSVREELRRMPFDVFCLSEKRGGLGSNNNRGLAAATGEFVLQLQDDWECRGPSTYLQMAVAILSARPELGLLLFKPKSQPLKMREAFDYDNIHVRVYDNGSAVSQTNVGQFPYSDWPHLKTKRFVDVIGPYGEGRPMWETELDYCQRVDKQMAFYVADSPDLDVFGHIGEAHSYNWPWKKRAEHILKRIPGGKEALSAYRRLKN